MLVCVPQMWPEPPVLVGPLGSLALTWAGTSAVVFAAVLVSIRVRWQLRRGQLGRDVIVRRHLRGRLLQFIGQFVVYGAALYGLGWGWVAQEILRSGMPGSAWVPPGAELLVLAPFLIGLLLSWAAFYDAERALHESKATADNVRPFLSRRAYVGYQARNNLVFALVPAGLVIVMMGVQRALPKLHNELWFQLVMWVVPLTAFVTTPWIFRLALGLTPLPPSGLRDRLTAASARLHFRCSNILLWPTRDRMANAMVVGIVPWLRYVVLTDRLSTELTPDEVEAVFGHEVGHVKHRHMLYYAGFFLVSMLVMTALWNAADVENLLSLTHREDLAVLPMFGLCGAYIFVVFGFLSRRCERQADIYGCRAVSCDAPDCRGRHEGEVALASGGRGLCPAGILTFIDALEKVAQLNGISRDKPGYLSSWQHSTIARRVEFLQQVLIDPSAERRFQRVVGRVKWAFLLVLVALLVALGSSQGWAELVKF